jgi:hypothetical protein
LQFAQSRTLLAMKMHFLCVCDGCGQLASPEHVARRLRRLEWATRYRPIHIGALFLGATSPSADSAFLYADEGSFQGQAKSLLQAAGLSLEGKTRDSILTEFQRGGFFLTHVAECPFDPEGDNPARPTLEELLEKCLPLTLSRIRRSLKPKRVIPISRLLEPILERLNPGEWGCALLLDGGQPFALDGEDPCAALARLAALLPASAAAGG